MKHSHDSECNRLAETFLADIGRAERLDMALIASLALAIQQAVEDWFADNQPVERTET